MLEIQQVTRTKATKITNIVFWVIWGVLTGVLWAFVNPISLVPGVIHLRIFAFLPAVIGIIFGSRSGFFSGYIGTLVWSLLAGTFIPAHSLLVDGIMVGVTGLLPALMVGRGRSFAELADDKGLIWKSALWTLVAGVAMVFAVSASLAFLKIFDFWWAVLWLGISDITPLVVGTPIIVKLLVSRLAKTNINMTWS